jgi:hypothetical protein
VSHCFGNFEIVATFAKSPSTKSIDAGMFVFFPEDKSSTPTTEKPSLAMRAATFEPINPATPVINTVDEASIWEFISTLNDLL